MLTIQNILKEKFSGRAELIGNEMVLLFCKKYKVSGSVSGFYDLYQAVQKAVSKEIDVELTKRLKLNKKIFSRKN